MNLKCPHCKVGELTASKFQPVTYGCSLCFSVYSLSWLQGYGSGLEEKNQNVITTSQQIIDKLFDLMGADFQDIINDMLNDYLFELGDHIDTIKEKFYNRNSGIYIDKAKDQKLLRILKREYDSLTI